MALPTHLDFWKIKKYYDVLRDYKLFCIKDMNYVIGANLRDLELKYFATLEHNEDGTINRDINIDRKYNSLDEFDHMTFCEDFIGVIYEAHKSVEDGGVVREISLYLTLNDNPYTLEGIKELIQDIID
tara:strand:+ start:1400 stop:1783 length:384 start_codon:yes stop_codon:yes gene_type:complete